MRDLMRRLHYSIHTERAYCDWVVRFVHFHRMEALLVNAKKNVADFLTHLAVQNAVANYSGATPLELLWDTAVPLTGK